MNLPAIASYKEMPALLKTERVTVFFQGGLGMVKQEARAWALATGKHAQYVNAVHATWIAKGARNRCEVVVGFRPTFVVVAGWDLPALDSPWQPATPSSPGVTTRQGRYSSCDPRWQADFDAWLADRVAAGAVILADTRGFEPSTNP